MKARRFNFVAFAFAGFLIYLLTLFGGMHWQFYNASMLAQGRIVYVYSPHKALAEFVVNNGERDVAYSLFVSRLQAFALGEAVEVRYDPKAPDVKPELNDVLNLWGLELILGVVAIAAMYAGISGRSIKRI